MLIRRHTDKQAPLPIPQPVVVVEKPKRKSRKKIEEKQEGTKQ